MNTLTNIGTNAVPGFIEDLRLVPIPPWWQNPWFIAGLLVLLAIVAFVGRRLWVRWQRRPQMLPSVEVPPGEAPDLVALRRLHELRSRMAQMSAYDFSTECSLIVRQFIGARFKLAIIFQTTREFLEHAQASPALSAGDREKLGEYLNAWDRVKFGQADMAQPQMEEMLGYAEKFVEGARTP